MLQYPTAIFCDIRIAHAILLTSKNAYDIVIAWPQFPDIGNILKYCPILLCVWFGLIVCQCACIVYMYVCMYVFVSTIYLYMVCVLLSMFVFVCGFIVYAWRTCVCTHTHAYTLCAHVRTHTCVHRHTYAPIHVCTVAHIHTRNCTCIHTHTATLRRPSDVRKFKCVYYFSCLDRMWLSFIYLFSDIDISLNYCK